LHLDLDGAERVLRAQVLANPTDRLRNAARRVDVIVLRVCAMAVPGRHKTQLIGEAENKCSGKQVQRPRWVDTISGGQTENKP
jgi:hypothetical protein